MAPERSTDVGGWQRFAAGQDRLGTVVPAPCRLRQTALRSNAPSPPLPLAPASLPGARACSSLGGLAGAGSCEFGGNPTTKHLEKACTTRIQWIRMNLRHMAYARMTHLWVLLSVLQTKRGPRWSEDRANFQFHTARVSRGAKHQNHRIFEEHLLIDLLNYMFDGS
jgi:hypothetical protein